MTIDIFEKCSEYTFDPYWKKVYLEFAEGKLPKGMWYHDGMLTWQRKVSIVIPNDPMDALGKITNFLRDNVGIYSPDDKMQFSLKKVERGKEWKDLTKVEKEGRIEEYLYKTFSDYSDEQMNILVSTIQIARSLKQITDSDIEYSDNEITNITGFHWDDDVDEWVIDTKCKIVKKTDKKSRSQKFYQRADRYFKEYTRSI